MKRTPASFRLKPITLEKIKDMAKDQNTSQGRVIDNLVTNHNQRKENAKQIAS